MKVGTVVLDHKDKRFYPRKKQKKKKKKLINDII